MEGIMNLPANVGGATSQDGLDSFAPLIAAQQAARDMGYPRFTRELLSAGSEMDQAEVQEFLQTIRESGLTSDDVALMRRVVEAVFGDPNNYPEVRARLLAEGVPEDILPETFDLEFFVALRMAVEEAENLSQEPRPTGQEMPMDMPLQMAEGGIVGLPQMTPIAREMAAMGRNGDTMLAHITPQEAMMLQRMGGSGTINPYTGLPEFFLKGLFRGIGKAFKSIGRAVKKFAKSTIGRIVISVALGAFLGPAAAGFLGASSTAAVAAISGAVGGFGSSILAGDDLKTALRSGVTGAVLAGGTAAITGGSAALQARPELQAAYQQQGFMGTVKNTAQNYFGSPVDTAKQMYGTEAAANVPAPGVSPVGDATSQVYSPDPTKAFQPTQGTQGFGTNVTQGLEFGLPDPASVNVPSNLGQGLPGGPGYPGGRLAGINVEQGLPSGLPDPASISGDLGQGPNFFDRAVKGAQDVYTDYLSPSRTSIQGRSADTIFKDLTLPKDQGGQFGFTSTPETLKLATEMAAKEAPGTFAKYGPIAAVTGTTLAATGGLDSLFKAPEQEPGESYEAYVARRNEAEAKFRQERPEFFGSFLASPNQGIMSTQPVMTAARGSGPKGVENFPRKNGAINGPGTGTSDDIPAMLSDGEFVFTAKSVRNMGGGSRRKGAAKMYKLMKMLEGGPVSKTAEA
jgi:hypothetical protein